MGRFETKDAVKLVYYIKTRCNRILEGVMVERHISHELKGKALCSYVTPVYRHVLDDWFVTHGPLPKQLPSISRYAITKQCTPYALLT